MPALIFDPKGDMGNLALTFPDLSAASFRPWIDESAARDAGETPDEYAQKTAELWRTDEETIRDEIEGTVSSLLGLVGIEADPLGSREHVLLSNLSHGAGPARHRA